MQKVLVYFSTSRGSILTFLVSVKNFVKKRTFNKYFVGCETFELQC